MLEALLRAGVAFPFSCQAGNCGTCKCELVSGDILELEHSEHALAPEQRAKGIILACRTQVWDDAVIRRIDAEDLVMHPSRVMRCRVLQLEALTHDIRGVHLAIEAGGPLTFSAGQYAQLEFAPGLSRHYSMANTSDEAELVFHEAMLKDLAARHPSFKYHIVLSEQKGGGRRHGLVHEAVDADLTSTENLMAYLAGPPVMVEAATALLGTRGLAPRQIHADAFYNQL